MTGLKQQGGSVCAATEVGDGLWKRKTSGLLESERARGREWRREEGGSSRDGGDWRGSSWSAFSQRESGIRWIAPRGIECQLHVMHVGTRNY
jgi:hypothetical protein